MFIVFDLDGTLANCDHRTHFLTQKPKDWESYFNACEGDSPHSEMFEMFNQLNYVPYNRVEIWTGRREDQREKTMKWFRKNGLMIRGVTLIMRPTGVITHDIKLKGEWLEERGKPDIIFEDRNSMVEFWRSKNIRCCQVQIGDF